MSNKVLQVCLVSNGALPIPDVKGGAIERLITMLIEDNEQYQNVEFTVITCKNHKAELLQSKFKYTKFINIRTYGTLYNKLAWKLRGLMRRLTNKEFYQFNAFERKAERYLLQYGIKFNYIISEGSDPHMMRNVAKKYGSQKLILHLHCHMIANPQYDKIYGNIWGVSSFVVKQYEKNSTLPKEAFQVLFNGIDLNRFKKEISPEERLQLRHKLGFTKNDFIIIFCGRIIKEKGVKELIQAILNIEESTIKLLIVGSSNFKQSNSGVYVNDITNLINSAEDRIKFTGFIDNADVYKYYKIADIGINPSLVEDACPLVLFEMLACGLPTIATLSGGMPEIGNPQTTIYIHKDERMITELEQSIMQLYLNHTKRLIMSKASIQQSEKYSRQKFYEDFCQLISKTHM